MVYVPSDSRVMDVTRGSDMRADCDFAARLESRICCDVVRFGLPSSVAVA